CVRLQSSHYYTFGFHSW
nr:immunoglobulin heavy chain junction region [Macaca mulatta]MOX65844.1 immunoglobulin heavy chain junction region [Macaca mulatta]MOX65891.1 immunoglobulin heavy chain junction region [Macaca mulatta]MOX65904.1 immunoglobulin heavy chain junction region [Macaca mulatta]MOX67723.1 immunoglobulin heavy chain junction region [Macaca mulatta]